MPKVSVIIPVFGVEQYIERCARSLFEQTIDDIEYLFIDDCTPDRSVEKLRAMLEDYPHRKKQVIIHRMEHNSGQAAVRKWGMQNAKGNYIIHCDSDDWVDADLFQLMYEKAISSEADMVVCDFVITDGEVQKIVKGINKKDTFLSDMMYSKVTWALWNKLVKRSICDSIVYPIHNVGEDMAMVLQMTKRAQKIEYITTAYYYYYYNTSSIMNRRDIKSVQGKYNQMSANIEIVEKDFIDCNSFKCIKPKLDAMKFYCQALLIPVLNKELEPEWKKKYSIPYGKILLNPNVRVRYKASYVFYKLKLYGVLMKIKEWKRIIC